MAQGFIEFFKRIEDSVTDFLKEISLNHSYMRLPRALVFGFVQIGLVNPALEVVHHQVRGDPAKVSEHALLDPDKSGKLLVENEFPEAIRAKRQDTQEKLRQGLLAAVWLGDKNPVAEIDLGFFRRLVIKPNGDLFRTGLAAGLFPKHPPKFNIPDLGGHLLVDLLDRGPLTVDFLADIIPIDLLLPTAALARRLLSRLQILAYRSA